MGKLIMERLLSDCFKHKNSVILKRKFMHNYTIKNMELTI